MSKKITLPLLFLFPSITTGSIFSKNSKSYNYIPLDGSETGKTNSQQTPDSKQSGYKYQRSTLNTHSFKILTETGKSEIRN